jgi:hypothetical protein
MLNMVTKIKNHYDRMRTINAMLRVIEVVLLYEIHDRRALNAIRAGREFISGVRSRKEFDAAVADLAVGDDQIMLALRDCIKAAIDDPGRSLALSADLESQMERATAGSDRRPRRS